MALKALTPTHLEMRAPGNWYVRAYARDKAEGGMLIGIYGNGETPQAAIDDDWNQVSAADEIVISGGGKQRRVRWTGYMWTDIEQGAPAK